MVMRLTHLSAAALLLLGVRTEAQTWDQPGLQGVGTVHDIALYNGDLYITGDFETIGGVTVDHIARWDGSAWAPVGTGLTSDGYGTALAVYNGELYVSGYFDTAGGVNAYRIARWNGSIWSNVLTGLDMLLVANDMLVIGNTLYIGGGPDPACNTPLVNMVQWNGTTFSTVGTGELQYLASSLLQGTVHALAEDQGDLYVTGVFDHVNGLACEGLLHWDGNIWSAGPPGLPTSYNLDVAFINGALTCAQNSDLVMQWNGTTWTDFTIGLPGSGVTMAMVELNGIPVIGGAYNAGPFAKNSIWAEVGSLTGAPSVQQLRVLNGELYAVGDQGVVVNGNVERHTLVARLASPLGLPDRERTSLRPYPNPATDRLYLDRPVHTTDAIRILDLQGRVVEGWSMQGPDRVDVRALPTGMYQLEVRQEGGLSVGRFVKE